MNECIKTNDRRDLGGQPNWYSCEFGERSNGSFFKRAFLKQKNALFELLALSLGYKQTHTFNGLFYGLPNREHIREGVGVNFCQNQPNIRFIVCLWVY